MAISEIDIIIDPTDVKIKDGDFDLQDANSQNLKHILIANPGDFLISPKIGGRINNSINYPSTDFRDFVANISRTLQNDGYSEVNVSGEHKLIQVDARRIKNPKRFKL